MIRDKNVILRSKLRLHSGFVALAVANFPPPSCLFFGFTVHRKPMSQMSAFHLWRRRTTRTKHLRPTAMIDYEKAVARCLGWGGGAGAGGWRSLLLLVALVASTAALYASFSSTLRVSAWFLVPPPSNSSPEEFVLLPSPPPTHRHTRPPLGCPPASTPPPTEVPVSTASPSLIAPSPSPAEGAYDPKTPPLVPDGVGKAKLLSCMALSQTLKRLPTGH